MDQLDKLKQQYTEHRQKALALTEKAQREDRSLTDAEMADIDKHVKAAKQLHPEIERTEQGLAVMELVSQASDHHFGVKAQGQREQHPWTKALTTASAQGAFGQKGLTGGGQGSAAVGSLGDPNARLGAPGGEILGLITVEPWGNRGDGSAASFLRQASRALHAAIVPIGQPKPASDVGLDLVAADLWTFAHQVPAVPIQWVQDAANLDTLLRQELVYGVMLAVEQGIVGGAGPLPGAPLGFLNDPAIQQVPAGDDAPGSILAGLTAVSTAGYAQGVVALSPGDWEAIQGMKDLQERPIYGGSPFSGPQRTLWSTPVVLSVAIPSGTAIVGDIGGAVRLIEREPVQVIVGTVNDEFTRNERTYLGEARATFVTVRPQALAKVALPAAGTFSAQATSASKTSSKAK